jgi:hypothetical protein
MIFNDREYAEELAEQFCSKLNVAYKAEDLLSVDFSFFELAKMGYSLSLLLITPDEYILMRQEFGLPLDEHTLEGLNETGGVYQFALKGRQYLTRGDHPSPLTSKAWMAAAIALYQVIRENKEAEKKD